MVSPGLSAAVVRRCQEARRCRCSPGVSTATEIMQALDLGLDTVKFFPAEANGGLASVKALAAAVPAGALHAHRRDHRRQPHRLPRAPRGRRGRRQLDGRARPARRGPWDEVTRSRPWPPSTAARPASEEPPHDRDPSRRASAASTSSRSARSCCGSTRARAGCAPPAASRPGRAAASTTWRAACARCFGLRAGVVTALADNEIGRLVENLIMQGGVDTSLIHWVPYDGIGRTVRNGLNFTERGFGVRGAVGVSDRGQHRDQPAHARRRRLGRPVRPPRRALAAHRRHLRRASRERRRPSPRRRWRPRTSTAPSCPSTSTTGPACGQAIGGKECARTSTRRLASHVDVMIGNEEDFTAAPRLRGRRHVDEHLSALPIDSFEAMVGTVAEKMPVASRSSRRPCAPSHRQRQRLEAIAWSPDDGVRAAPRDHLAIFDRVGGGDSFASGLVYGLLEGEPLQQCLELRRRPRRAGDDHARRHVDGDPGGGPALAGGGSARVRR